MFTKQVLAFLLLHMLHVGTVLAQSGRLERILTADELRVCIWTNYSLLVTATPPAVNHLTPYAYAVGSGDEAWHARVERFVAAIKRDGRLLAAARRHKLDSIALRD